VSDHRYQPAARGWIVVCREDLVLGVDPATSEERVGALWPLVRDGAASAALLDEMTRGGISAAPGFALLEAVGGSWRVLARGDVVVEVAGDDSAVVDGRGATAWVERDVAGSPTLRVRPGGSSPSGPSRALRVGVVVADGWEVGPEAVVEPVPVAAPNAEPAPSAEPATAEAVPPAPVVAPAPDVPAAQAADPVVPVTENTLLAQTISASEVTEIVPPDDPDETPRPDVAPAEQEAGYDHLFGMTVVRKVEDAAVREPDDEPGAPPEDRTKVATDLAARRALRRAAKAAADAEAAAAGPTHWLELSTGGREELDGTVVVGRAPSATRVSAGNIPRLVTMTTPNQDISRTHAQISVEGGTVVVTDLHSSNGTFVVLPGRSPQKLRAGEPTPVVVDTVIDLGDGATLTVRVDA
jgi:hypothetical protein